MTSDRAPDSDRYEWPAYGPPAYGPMAPYGGPVPPYGPAARGYLQPGMRAASADRDRTMDILKAAFSEGRLTREEFDDRASRVLAAKTYGDLSALVADLPQGPFGTVTPYPYQLPVPPPRTNGCAMAALVFGILPLFCGIPAVILGHTARSQIRRTGERGIGLATTGLVLGYAWVGFITLLFIVGLAHS